MTIPGYIKEAMPNTMILGAAKSGTTTLNNLLSQHPQVFQAFEKEPMFFSRDDYFNRGVEWYANKYFLNREYYAIRSEASPHYLYWAYKVSPRIKDVFHSRPIKFLIILRNPIKRAYSWYWNMLADGRETLPFIEALKAEEERIRDNFEELQYYGSMQYGYYRGGCYTKQIRAFFNDFPTKNFLILLQEDLLKDQKTTMKKVFNFLNIESNVKIKSTFINPSAKPYLKGLHKWIRTPSRFKDQIKRTLPPHLTYKLKSKILKANLRKFNYPNMEEEAYQNLKENFKDEISSLSKMIGRDLTHWLQQPKNDD